MALLEDDSSLNVNDLNAILYILNALFLSEFVEWILKDANFLHNSK